jgi:hypothetical protein
MAKTMSIIRYKYKADRDFESVQFEGMSCSLGELKRLIVERSSRSGTHHPRDDYDLIISNATTHEGKWFFFFKTFYLFSDIYIFLSI